ncbi:uncharacterized protein ARMOST_11980 [Armillaria ostoyae]|uniref:F-box domain-containing protein n=1 Tax=Armillaria ostoyae TaxID=47428 RepID=A0A284RIP9_ARMOS|nr:uncharacterized protein ARMOST_11980 [Armillaria ostoyae]
MDEQNPLQLPTEVLHQIVDAVAEQDDADSTLVAITQASRVMGPRANEHIFETVDINIDWTDAMAMLNQSYTANPTLLAKYPRNLNLWSDGDPTDLLNEPLFGTIVSHMQNLRTVSVVECDIEGRPFIDAFAAPTKHQITSLELRCVDLTYHEFATFLSSLCLTHLNLGELVIAEYESNLTCNVEAGIDFSSPNCSLPQPQSALKRPLQDLRLDLIKTSDAVVMDLIVTSRHPIIAEDSLVNVSFSSDWCTDEDVYRFQRFIDCKAVKSAETLRLGDSDEYYFTEADSSEYNPLKFDMFKSVEFFVRDRTPESEFKWWAKSLRTVRASSPLKELRLQITFHHLDVNDLPDMATTEWENFDDALCGRNLALEHLSIDIVTMQPLSTQIEASVRDWFLTCLPGVREEYFNKGTGKTAFLNVY